MAEESDVRSNRINRYDGVWISKGMVLRCESESVCGYLRKNGLLAKATAGTGKQRSYASVPKKEHAGMLSGFAAGAK